MEQRTGENRRPDRDRDAGVEPFPPSLTLTPVARWPTTLPDATVAAVLARPIPMLADRTLNNRGTIDVSIIVVTYNNLAFTRLCLESLFLNTDGLAYEVIVVDNASTDGTVEYLTELARTCPHLRVVQNERNRGFAPANNQGLALARGDVLVLLNNDAIPPPGWLSGLLRWLKDPAIGMVGPVTNRIGNEAQITATYHTYGEMVEFARQYTAGHRGECMDIRMLAMFCVALRRSVFGQVGPLDERFEVGMLEDEDYSIRVRAAGYRVVCVEDVFVHHFGQASFGKLAATGEYQRLSEVNRRRFEEKWGVRWEPYQHRPDPSYQDVAQRLAAVARAHLPADSTVLVVSKGDPALLPTGPPRAGHFPQAADGSYPGFHPADSASAIAHLEELRERGAAFLVFPQPALWWLEHYDRLRAHLEERYDLIVCQPDTCLIYDLRQRNARNGEAFESSHD